MTRTVLRLFETAGLVLALTVAPALPAAGQEDLRSEWEATGPLLSQGKARLEIAGGRQAEGAVDTVRLKLFFRANGPRELAEALTVISLPSGTALLAAIDLDSPRAAELELRFREAGAEVLRQRGLGTLNAFVSRATSDVALSQDSHLAVLALKGEEQVALAEIPYDGDSFGLVADLVPQGTTLKAKLNKACFSWSCPSGISSGTCSFDSSCSVTHQGLLWQHYWTWGDGTASLVPGNVNQTTHQFGAGQYFHVTLNNWYYSGGNEPSISCCVHARTVIGPPDGLEEGVCQGAYNWPWPWPCA